MRMTINELQHLVDKRIREVGNGYFSELTNMAVLTEEVGELARVISRVYGDQRPKPSDLPQGVVYGTLEENRKAMKPRLAEELADVVWVTVCLANQTGVDLEQALNDALRKKTLRDADRFALD